MTLKNISQNKRKSVILCLAVLAIICFLIPAFTVFGSSGQMNLDNVVIKEYYNVGNEVTFADATINVGGKDYTIKPTVKYPDGSAQRKNIFTLDQLGKYSIVYEIKVGNDTYREEKNFVVYDYLFSNSATGEGFAYGTNHKSNVRGEFDYEGVKFNLKAGESLLYNKVINLNKLGKEDTLVMLNAIPEQGTVRDCTTLYVVLTDAYDTSNQVKIRVLRAPDAPVPNSADNDISYLQARFDSTAFGLGTNLYGSSFRNGLLEMSFVPIDIRFDYANKCIYSFYDSVKYNGVEASHGYKLINDLTNDFGNKPWKGFTTGECFLSVYAEGYISSDTTIPFHGILLAVDGQEIEDIEEGALGTNFVTEVAKREIQFGEYGSAKNIPNAMVGYAYEIFDAEYYSLYGGDKLYTSVYYAYNTSSMVEVPIANGRFTPDRVGVYTIVYTVVDAFGNVSTSTLDVTAIADNGKGVYVEVPDYENYTTGNVGNVVPLVNASSVEVLGNLGLVDVTVVAKDPDGKIYDVTNDEFIPKVGGTWKIVYTVQDHAGRIGKFEYDLTVNVSDKVVFTGVKDLGKYFIAGAFNPVPAATYIDYLVSYEEQFVTDISIEKQDGTKVADVTDGYFKPTETGLYNVVYKAVSANNVENVYKVPVRSVDVGFNVNNGWNRHGYFVNGNGDVVGAMSDNQGSHITVKANGSFDYIRPVDITSFKISFMIKETQSSSISLVITDVNDENQSIKLTFVDNQGVAELLINDRQKVVLGSQAYCGMMFYVNFSAGIVTIGDYSATVSEYYNGKTYNGFGSLLANISFVTNNDQGMNGNSVILIDEINAQPFTKAGRYADRLEPTIIFSESFTSKFIAGQVIKIPHSKVIDVLTPKATATLTVLGPDGIAIRDTDGNLLENVDISKDYYIELEKAGYYQLCYSSADQIGNEINGELPYKTLLASSTEKPEIKINGGARTGKVGEYFSVGTATASGQFDNYELYIFVQGPTGNLKAVEMQDRTEADYMKFMAKEKGKYKVLYLVIDEWKNMSTAEYFVTVS